MRKISFSFGASYSSGADGVSLRKKYESSALKSKEWLEGTSPETSGHGWYSLPDGDVDGIIENAEWLSGYSNIVQVGIGGSALGNLMLHEALAGYCSACGTPKFFMADNPDPEKLRFIWESVRGTKTALIGVSKSGSTAETMTQFLWLRERLRENGGSDNDILIITDPKNGIFRSFANNSGCRVLDLPASVGGRFSVLSSVGLVSAAALGIDVRRLLKGAAEMREFLAKERDFDKNPALKLAALHLEHERNGRNISVLMPYSSKMSYFCEWYAQLWAESLGKNACGTTPVRAIGAIDQHSQVQLYTEGPDDKFFTLFCIKNHGEDVAVPQIDNSALDGLRYLENQKIGEMLNLEAQSTAAAIVKSGHPLLWVELDEIGAETLGRLIFFYEYLTALTGNMMGIDPFDQPGVEQGKKYTYGLMGRVGYDKDAEEVRSWFSKISADMIGVN
ncbi:MAG: glucose-6-phosphate isomerase [Synergistes sp.]|nr:glucose-6-phosphate isomerase [Synergistes sp.]